MIKRSIIITSLIIPYFLCIAAVPDSLYYSANEKYQEGKYEEAIELYEKIISQGYESPALYFNLGNTYFRSNKLGKARTYYEKALKLDPNNEDVKTNLNYLKNILVDKFEDIPELFLKTWIKSFISLMNSDRWALISMISFVFAAFMFSTYLLIRKISLRKTGFYGGTILLIIAIITFIFSWRQRNT